MVAIEGEVSVGREVMSTHDHPIWQELTEHLPYTLAASCAGLAMVGLLTFASSLLGREQMLPDATSRLFHVAHPTHMFFSAAVTAAMFRRYRRSMWMACSVGIMGALTFCGLSDVLIPFLGGSLMKFRPELHLCVVVHPNLVLPFVLLGALTGMTGSKSILQSTVFGHSGHVLVSSMASLFYLISFGVVDWMASLGAVFVIVTLAVLVPCCLSDIVFPLLAARSGEKMEMHHHG